MIMTLRGKNLAVAALAAGILTLLALSPVSAQRPPQPPKGPWMDKIAAPRPAGRHGHRADDARREDRPGARHRRIRAVGPAVQRRRRHDRGIPRLGIPDLQLADSAVGVRAAAERGRYATLLPSTLAEAATWDLKLAFAYGDLIGRELRDQQYNVSLGGGVNIMREPRNGRNFEYLGEDPILAGQDGRPVGQGAAEQQRHRRRQALRLQRPGDRPQHRQRQDRTSAPPARPTCWRSRSPSPRASPAW